MRLCIGRGWGSAIRCGSALQYPLSEPSHVRYVRQWCTVAHKTLPPPGPMQENALSIDPAFGMQGQHAQLLDRRHLTTDFLPSPSPHP